MNKTQREALSVLADVWELSPDVRLGQLMAHLGFLGEAHIGKGLGYIEDDELIAVLCGHRAELQNRLESAHNGSGAPTDSAGSTTPKATSPDARLS